MSNDAKLRLLRDELARRGVDGFIVPMADEFQNEYVPVSARRVEFVTGFTGSAGTAIMLQDRAAFFTDSRYTLQAGGEVSPELFAQFDGAKKSPGEWLAENLKAGDKFGYDPWLHTPRAVERLQKAVAKAGAGLVALDGNPVDAIWKERPAPPLAPVVPHGIEFAGRSAEEKRQALAAALQGRKRAAAMLTDPASVAWLLNIRGGDVPHIPLPLSFAILHADAAADWFVDGRKLTPELAAHLGDAVRVKPIAAFGAALDELGAQAAEVEVDLGLCAAWIVQRLEQAGAKPVHADDPCLLPRACKNAVEQAGMRNAHRRDGAALTKFLGWLAAQPPGSVSELQVDEVLEEYRAAQNLFRGPSFSTIAGSGPHGALAHYCATAATDRKLQAGELLLLDSGGQYLDGTTDVTRTVAIGNPSDEMRDRYTRVLKGHIALASARFPPGTRGGELDVLARQYLWAAGVDYGYGTGHGVGSYLSVHEGPQGISRGQRGDVALQPGMVLSNEPGYHKPGAYGIRFENLMLVTEASMPEGGEQAMLGFETLTLAPLDRNLLLPGFLTVAEIDWINDYHARVRAEIAGQLNGDAKHWLMQATESL
ncbi:MAG: aminopeptidase P family protein [Alphaproteobacteria bacterium]